MNTRQKRIQFFAANSGYATPPGRMACAKALADAEELADDNEWELEVWPEDLPYEDCLGDHAYWCDRERKGEVHTHDVVEVRLMDYCECDGVTPHHFNSHVLDSLGAVIEPSADYLRVLRAEMANEVRAGADGAA